MTVANYVFFVLLS